MKKIFIVEDSPAVIENLNKIIKEISGLSVIGSVNNVNDAILNFYNQRPDIVILDIGLVKSNGIEVLAELKGGKTPPIVIMFTNYSRDAFRKATIRMGADYFFDKTRDLDLLIDLLTQLSKQ